MEDGADVVRARKLINARPAAEFNINSDHPYHPFIDIYVRDLVPHCLFAIVIKRTY